MYRFRVDEGKLVLQVYEPPANNYGYGYEREGKWRDAEVADIPIADPFRSDPPQPTYSQPCRVGFPHD